MGFQGEVPNDFGAADTSPPSSRAATRASPWWTWQILCPSLFNFHRGSKIDCLEFARANSDPIFLFIDVEEIGRKVLEIYAQLGDGRDSFSPDNNAQGMAVVDEGNVRILAMLLTSSLVLEGLGTRGLDYELFESFEYAINQSPMEVKCKCQGFAYSGNDGEFDTKSNQYIIPPIMSKSIYHFHCDEKTLARRTIWFVARLYLEMDLYRKESLFLDFLNPWGDRGQWIILGYPRAGSLVELWNWHAFLASGLSHRKSFDSLLSCEMTSRSTLTTFTTPIQIPETLVLSRSAGNAGRWLWIALECHLATRGSKLMLAKFCVLSASNWPSKRGVHRPACQNVGSDDRI